MEMEGNVVNDAAYKKDRVLCLEKGGRVLCLEKGGLGLAKGSWKSFPPYHDTGNI